MSDTEKKKIVMIELPQPDFYKADVLLNMVTRQQVIDSGLPMYKLSDFGERHPRDPKIAEIIKKKLDGKWHPAKSHTVKNVVKEIKL